MERKYALIKKQYALIIINYRTHHCESLASIDADILLDNTAFINELIIYSHHV